MMSMISMISILALFGGLTGMFALFGVAWKILEPTLGVEATEDEVGPTPITWQNEPTPTPTPTPPPNGEPPPTPAQVARNTSAWGVPPRPPDARRPTRRPPPLPPCVDDDNVKTHFFDRAMLSVVEAKLEPTEVLGGESDP